MTTAQERKQLERRARRRLIQEAAREIFATKGYAKTSIEQVAQSASLSVGAIYLYFRSKEDLYISLIEAPLKSLAVEITHLQSSRDLPSPLRAAWQRLIEWATKDPEHAVILRTLAQPEIRSRLSDDVTSAVAAGLQQAHEALASVVSTGIELGIYRRVEPAELATIVWSLFLGSVQSSNARRTVELVGPSLEDSARWAFDAVELGLATGRARVAEAA